MVGGPPSKSLTKLCLPCPGPPRASRPTRRAGLEDTAPGAGQGECLATGWRACHLHRAQPTATSNIKGHLKTLWAKSDRRKATGPSSEKTHLAHRPSQPPRTMSLCPFSAVTKTPDTCAWRFYVDVTARDFSCRVSALGQLHVLRPVFAAGQCQECCWGVLVSPRRGPPVLSQTFGSSAQEILGLPQFPGFLFS